MLVTTKWPRYERGTGAVIDLGDPLNPTLTIRDADGQLANATAVTLSVIDPDGIVSTCPVMNEGIGRYTALFTPPAPGRYVLRWVATGANAGAHVDVVQVADPTLAALISLADIKEYLNKSTQGTVSDEELRTTLDAATSLAEQYCARALRPGTWTGPIWATGSGVLILPEPAATSIVAVTNSADVDVTSSVVLNQTGEYVRHATPGQALSGRYTVTVRVGVTGRTLDIAQQGVRELVRHMWEPQRGQAPRPLQGAATRPGTAHALPWLVSEKLDQIRLDT